MRAARNLGAVGVLAIAAVVWVVALMVWIELHRAGLLGLAAAVALVVLLVVAGKHSKHRRTHRAEAEELSRWGAWLVKWPEPSWEVLATLHDDTAACAAWAVGKLATEPKWDARGGYTPGAWPRVAWELWRAGKQDDKPVRECPAGIEVDVIPQPGVTLGHFTRALAELPWALRMPEVKVLRGNPLIGTVTLALCWRDPVAEVVPAPTPEEPVNLYALCAGVRSSGEYWRLPLMERNILVIGAMGSGKSGIMRALVLATAPAARDGLVYNMAIDLKFGLEVRLMRGLLHEVATTSETALDMLRRVRAMVEERGAWMEANGIATHVPTPERPLVHVIIDELAELLDDPENRAEVMRLKRRIMRPGRALGFSISGFSQSADKELLGSVRGLYQIKMGLRLADNEMLRMVYGSEAEARGAGNLQLPDQGSAGIAFAVAEGGRDIERVRAFLVTPEKLAWAAETYPIRRHPNLEPPLALPPGNSAVVESRGAMTATPRITWPAPVDDEFDTEDEDTEDVPAVRVLLPSGPPPARRLVSVPDDSESERE